MRMEQGENNFLTEIFISYTVTLNLLLFMSLFQLPHAVCLILNVPVTTHLSVKVDTAKHQASFYLPDITGIILQTNAGTPYHLK